MSLPGGLLVDGERVLVDGLKIYGPGDEPWCRLHPADYRPRPPGVRPTQIVVHTTWGGPQQTVVPGSGPGDQARRHLSYWAEHPVGRQESAAAHLLVDEDESVYCAADLGLIAAHHATTANAHSIGIELCQRVGGRIYESVLRTAVRLTRALCTGEGARRTDGRPWPGLWIPYQVAAGPYRGAPIRRLVDGGRSFRGVYGHRDQTSARGWGDPGDPIFRLLEADGCEPVETARSQDLDLWRARQVRLRELGYDLVVDGIAGRRTLEAVDAAGLPWGRGRGALAS